jgi:hypothetical protein
MNPKNEMPSLDWVLCQFSSSILQGNKKNSKRAELSDKGNQKSYQEVWNVKFDVNLEAI